VPGTFDGAHRLKDEVGGHHLLGWRQPREDALNRARDVPGQHMRSRFAADYLVDGVPSVGPERLDAFFEAPGDELLVEAGDGIEVMGRVRHVGPPEANRRDAVLTGATDTRGV
jgi:hypothetical protein